MSDCIINNVPFYKPDPKAIRCMSLQESTRKLAVSRSDASIEIWNINNVWFIERTIPPAAKNSSIEGLAWCGERLLSVGLYGLLTEYNLYGLCLRNEWAVTGGEAFCLDVNKEETQIAIGTEQGYLNIFSVTEDGISFEKCFDKQGERILCLQFSHDGEFVVSGGINAIRIWNVQSGHAIHRMPTGRSASNMDTKVWCLAVTKDFTIISGDSRGHLTFWDGNDGSQIESYQSHKADILAISLSDKSLYCAGVDPNIISYEKVKVKGGTHKWVRSIQRKIHEHDVNALVVCDNKLYSGGADCYLSCSFHPPRTLLKLPPILQQPCIHLSQKARFLMLRYSEYVDVWSLGRSQNTEASDRGIVSLEEGPKKLLKLQRIKKDYDGVQDNEAVICSCISDDGCWIIYSMGSGTELFRFFHEEEKIELLKIRDFEHRDVPCINAIFTPNNCQLITTPNTGGLLVYDLHQNEKPSAVLSQTITLSDSWDTITFMTISSCSRYLVIGDPRSNIAIFTWTQKNKQWNHHCKLPKYKCPPTAMAIHPVTLSLVVVYSDNKIVEYDVKERHFTQFSRHLEQKELKSRGYPIRSITFDPRVEHIIILHDNSSMMIINKQKISSKNGPSLENGNQETNDENAIEPTKKMKMMAKNNAKSDNSVNGNQETNNELAVKTIKKHKHLVHLEWLGENELVAVEVNPIGLLKKLAPAFAQKTFGMK